MATTGEMFCGWEIVATVPGRPWEATIEEIGEFARRIMAEEEAEKEALRKEFFQKRLEARRARIGG